MKISKDFLRGLGAGLLISALIVALLGAVYNPQPADTAQAGGAKDKISSNTGKEDEAHDKNTDASGTQSGTQTQTQTPAPAVQSPAPATQDSAGQNPMKPAEVEFNIPEGATSQQISEILLEKGLIQDKDAFTQLILERGVASKLARGTFKMPLGLTMDEIANRLILK